MNEIEFAKKYWTPYKGKENIKWEIRWDSIDSNFAFFLYVWEEKGIRVYRELIPNEILKSALGNSERINDIVEVCIDKLGKINGTDFKRGGEK